MSFFGGGSSSSSSTSSSAPLASNTLPDQNAKKQMVMDQLRGQMALANAQGLLEKMNDKCFLKCVTKPSTSLSSWEQGCLGNCMDRYMEAYDTVSRAYTHRVAQEAQGSADPSLGPSL
ncbi:hypothetical protein DL93DRAFT_615820 [Clavulina sp. PMI_390]|nr:hypothetical protein DL93DRAFT_615820 [Clavulina sp. PMI_390]